MFGARGPDSRVSRLDATTRLLQGAAVPSGGVYGRHRDTEIYDALLEGNTAVFVNLAQELAKSFTSDTIDRVVGDAAEGWNPIHDAFRLTVNAAAVLASRDRALPIEVFEFPLFGQPGPGAQPQGALSISLSAREQEAKREAALHYVELDREVRWILERYGEIGYTTEWLRPSRAVIGDYRPADDPPLRALRRVPRAQRPARPRDPLPRAPAAHRRGARGRGPSLRCRAIGRRPAS